jgi:hypothetical protein
VAAHRVRQDDDVVPNAGLIGDAHLLPRHYPLAQRRHVGDTDGRMHDGLEPGERAPP